MHNEVNFEKRGRLEDHYPCLKCGACICHRICFPWSLFISTLFIILVLLVPPVFAAELTVPYDFHTFDVDIPGHPGLIAFPAGLNDKRDILSNIQQLAPNATVIIHGKVNKRGKVKAPAIFSCSDTPFLGTFGEAINRRGDIVGNCLTNEKEVGFIRFKSGVFRLFDFPGADGTRAKGLSDNRRIAGQFFGPFNPVAPALTRFHCWTFDLESNSFSQIDFPIPSTFVDCTAINRKEQILVRFIVVNAANQTVSSGFAIHDNGVWSFPFPLSMEDFGGPGLFVADMNKEGAAIIERFNGDADWNGLVLYDDGGFFKIDTPDDWLNIQVGGMNNKGEFVGTYLIESGFIPFPGPGKVFTTHGFLAVPQ